MCVNLTCSISGRSLKIGEHDAHEQVRHIPLVKLSQHSKSPNLVT